MFFTAWIVFHVLVCIALVVVVLMQSAKGEGLAGSAFGGGGGVGQAVFGGKGAASFLSHATTVLAIVFFLNCGVLAFMSAGGRSGESGEAGAESAIPQRMQQEMEAQRQQYQQQQLADSSAGSEAIDLEQLMNESEQPADTSGGGQ